MFTVRRSQKNPLLSPIHDHGWESYATFNGCPISIGKTTYLLYRAQSSPEPFENSQFSLSTICRATITATETATDRKQFIVPEEDWERYGCEDPRVTYLNGKYFIFYTALSHFPFSAPGIKVGLAISKDLKTVDEKHLVTPFNAKAMALFPEKINGKITAILTAKTDEPPAKIGIAQFNNEEDMWSEEYWNTWLKNIDKNTLNLKRGTDDQVELGAPPLKTKKGWLIVYSHIQKYYTSHKIFGIEAVLLDLKDPRKIIARTYSPLLVPEESYEKYGIVPNTIFPSGALIEKDILKIYYGSTDTTCSVAEISLSQLLDSMLYGPDKFVVRSKKNPILKPTNNSWEKRAVFNPAAIELKGKIHIMYRSMSEDNTSYFGYASSKNGEKIDLRLDKPIYSPRETFERKGIPNGNSGCEDPRITEIGNKLYLCYTAYNGIELPAVAISSILTKDFLAQKFNWSTPFLISPPGVDDKDACIVPFKKGSKYLLFHRLNNTISASYIDIDTPNRVREHTTVLEPRPGMWDSKKVGLTMPPIETTKGWLLIYHAISDNGVYRVGLALLDRKDPTKVIARSTGFIFEPKEVYEREGQISNVVFPCGAVVRHDELFIYYGGADSVVGLAKASIRDLLNILLS